MFYSRELLSLRRGKFSILWLAATRGTKFITKRDIIAFDIESSWLTQQRKPDMMDIEIPLKSHDDFGTLELPGALYDSQLDWQIYPTNGCTFGEDFRTEFLTDLFGCEQNDHKHGILEQVPEDLPNFGLSQQFFMSYIQTERREPVAEEASTSVPSGAKKARFEEEMGALPANMSDIPNDPSLLIAPTGTAGTPLARSSAEEPQLRPPCAASSAKRCCLDYLLPRGLGGIRISFICIEMSEFVSIIVLVEVTGGRLWS
ncbi:unnamed protein product [Dibothriocephalus latus]|uniref:Uncharacterized protein n=1 Tax=Dibothriocephalus latus TaxID=60516 RepID=A0A3P7NQX2_DIBLA|nr:unnamed protein product [Dibothriocephalus latus]